MKILLVEDDMQRGEQIKKYLERADIDVTLVDDGYSAMREVEQSIPDIVFSDLNLPYMDGFALAHDIKLNDRFKSIKFIMYSSRPIREDARSLAKELGVDECLRYTEPQELTLEALTFIYTS